MKQKSEKNQGITLIALVITIIVLLILAAVSIATLTGENGILTKAQTAKTETEKASEEEQMKLAQLNATMNIQGYKYDTEDGQKVPIPAGFAPTQIEGQNSVSDGLVVVDSKGNEFVWIPVTSGDDYIRNEGYVNKEVSSAAEDDTDYLPDDLKAKAIGEKTEGNIEKETVVNSGGFYISRYEAGKETKDGKDILVSKREATVWTNIRHDDEDGEQGCKTVAKTFINNSEVKSGLITGIQWDMVMKFIVDNRKDNTFDVETADSSRHTGSKKTSGQTPADKVCNIYDLEGNCCEYVAERSDYLTDYSYVYRGGNYSIEQRLLHGI